MAKKYLNLWETADALGIERWRLGRLGRFLRLDPSESRVPSLDVQRMAAVESVEDRYVALRQWLLGQLRTRVKS